MNRMQLRAPKGLRRRPLRARRLAVAHQAPMEYSTAPTARWVVIGTGALGAGVAVELLVAMVVMVA